MRGKNPEEPYEKTALASVLKKFYAGTRKSEGSPYSKSFMTFLQFGLNKHFKTIRTDIIKDPTFAEGNNVFLAKCVDLKRWSLAKVEHKPAISENDLRKLYECGIR